MARAYQTQTYNYLWNVTEISVLLGPYHGLDMCYTFYPFDLIESYDGFEANVCNLGINGNTTHQDAAKLLQTRIINFVGTGNPTPGSPPIPWPVFGPTKLAWNINPALYNITGQVRPDPQLPEDRCAFWQRAPYMPPT